MLHILFKNKINNIKNSTKTRKAIERENVPSDNLFPLLLLLQQIVVPDIPGREYRSWKDWLRGQPQGFVVEICPARRHRHLRSQNRCRSEKIVG